MIRVAEYSVDVVFAAMETTGKAVLPDGLTFRRRSGRLVLFKAKGTTCVTCGIEGNVFIMETHSADITPHLNLYALNDKGDRVLMTKDHIIPKSKGGPNTLANYNTMCMPCNSKKADNLV